MSSLLDSFDGLGVDSLPPTAGDCYFSGYGESQFFSGTSSPPPIHVSGGGFSDQAELSPRNEAIQPEVAEMGRDEGIALREWRRENALRLAEKERREKELLSQILAEAEEYKVDFHSKRKVNCETDKVTNREKEKILVASLQKVHAEANKNYWKSIAELIPNEVRTIEKKREKKGEEKKQSITVIQGPKPGKPTELSRMRHILLKLKHETPSHLKLLAPSGPAKDAQTSGTAGVSGSEKVANVATPVGVVAVA